MQRGTLATLVLGFMLGCSNPSPDIESLPESSRPERPSEEPKTQPAEKKELYSPASETPPPVRQESVKPPEKEQELPLSKLLADAMLALQEDNVDTAYKLARQAMSRAGDDPQTRFTYGLVLGKRQRYPEAIRLLDQAGEDMPQARLPALGQTAEWMVKFGRYEEARLRFEKILSSVPGAAMAHENLAKLLIRQGLREETKSNLEFLSMTGQCDEFLLRSMLCYSKPFPGDAENLLNDPIGSLGMARNLAATAQWSEAKKVLNKSEMIGNSTEANAFLGRCYAELMDKDSKPLQLWHEANRTTALKHADAWYARGTWLYSQKQFSESLGCFAEAALLDQSNESTYRRIADCLKQAGENEKAQQATTRAETVRKTHQLGSEFAASAVRSGSQLSEMIDALIQLRRLDEAICWRELQVDYAVEFGALSKEDAAPIRKQIQAEREGLIEQGRLKPKAEFVTFGLLTAD
ncbi:MAG: hypothetical protein AAF802_24450 [Planctomycetota bacterium]